MPEGDAPTTGLVQRVIALRTIIGATAALAFSVGVFKLFTAAGWPAAHVAQWGVFFGIMMITNSVGITRAKALRALPVYVFAALLCALAASSG